MSGYLDDAETKAVSAFVDKNRDHIREVCTLMEAGSDYEYGAIALAYALGRVRGKAAALREAADAWEDPANTEELIALADEHYHAGGPSMPAIWLRERADRIEGEDR